jgi:hypothetical protein
MGSTQGVILLMLGALALYLMWNSKSPFASNTATQAQIDAAKAAGAAASDAIINRKANPSTKLKCPDGYYAWGNPDGTQTCVQNGHLPTISQ